MQAGMAAGRCGLTAFLWLQCFVPLSKRYIWGGHYWGKTIPFLWQRLPEKVGHLPCVFSSKHSLVLLSTPLALLLLLQWAAPFQYYKHFILENIPFPLPFPGSLLWALPLPAASIPAGDPLPHREPNSPPPSQHSRGTWGPWAPHTDPSCLPSLQRDNLGMGGAGT